VRACARDVCLRADFEELAAGYLHSCGLTNGTLRCWGYGGWGESTVPAITGGWKSLSTGHGGGPGFTCGILLADNSARCWGASGHDYGQTTVPAITGGWASLTTGAYHV
jgi:hypothetical protein